MGYRLGVLLGDGIGPEVVPEAVRVAKAAVKAAGLELEWIDMPVGRAAYDAFGTTLPDGTLEKLAELDGWVLGPQEVPRAHSGVDEKAINPSAVLRKHFDLHANIRPVRSYPSLAGVRRDVDLVIVRENNEGFPPDRNMFAGRGEFMPSAEVAMSVRVITRTASARLARVAFDLASRRNKHVTCVHKDTVFRLSCGLFTGACREVAKEHPDIAFDEVLIDAMAMELVRNPRQFDVIVTTNLFGDILSDLAAGLVGGLGMAPALQMGPAYAMAQATHGTAPDIAGKGIANPYAEIISVKMLLAWLGATKADGVMTAAAEAIEAAVDKTVAAGRALTPDLGGSATTRDMGRAVADLIPPRLAP